MKLAISIVVLAFASNFIWLVICADFSKKDSNLAKKSFNSTNATISNSNSTIDLKNSTLKIDKSKNSTLKSTKTDGKTKTPLAESGSKIGNIKLEKNGTSGVNVSGEIPGNWSNFMRDKKTNVTISTNDRVGGKSKTIDQPNPKLPNGTFNKSPKIGDKTTTTSQPSIGKMTPTTERAKTMKEMKQPGIGSPPVIPIGATNLPKKPIIDDKIKPPPTPVPTKSSKNQRPISPAPISPVLKPAPILQPSNALKKPVNEKVGPKQETFKTTTAKPLGVPINPSSILSNPMLKLPIGAIADKMMPTTEKAKLKKDLEKPIANTTTDDAIDNAWKIVNEKKYDNLGNKTLPKYEIPAGDLAELENENGTATNASVAILKDAVAKEVKVAMDKFEEKHQKQMDESKKDAEDDEPMEKWKVVALVLIPLFLVTFGIMLIIGIRQRMNVAKGRSVVYELTSELGKKNNEKPVIST